jgi:hypothetical protein
MILNQIDVDVGDQLIGTSLGYVISGEAPPFNGQDATPACRRAGATSLSAISPKTRQPGRWKMVASLSVS